MIKKLYLYMIVLFPFILALSFMKMFTIGKVEISISAIYTIIYIIINLFLIIHKSIVDKNKKLLYYININYNHLLFIILLLVINVIISQKPSESLQYFARVTLWILFLINGVYILNNKEYYIKYLRVLRITLYLTIIVQILTFSLSLLGIDVMEILFSIPSVPRFYGEGWAGIFTSGVHQGGFLMVSLYTIYRLFNYKEKSLYKYGIIDYFFILSIFALLTKTVILGFLVYLFIVSKKRISSIYQVVIIIVLLVFFGIEFISEEFLIDRFRDVYYFIGMPNYTSVTTMGQLGSGRFGMWNAIIEGMAQNGNIFNYLFGFGLGSDMVFTDLFWIEKAAHNDILRILTNLGILGLIVSILLLTSIYKNTKKHTDSASKELWQAYIYFVIVYSLFQGIFMGIDFIWVIIISYLIHFNHIHNQSFAFKINRSVNH